MKIDATKLSQVSHDHRSHSLKLSQLPSFVEFGGGDVTNNDYATSE